MTRLKSKTGILSTVLFFILLIFCLYYGSFFNILLTLTALIIHELTHIFCSEIFDYRFQEFHLNPWSGLKLDPSLAINPEAELIVAAAGPASNFLMVAGVLYLKLLGISNTFLQSWLQINVLIGLFNLIPALPLDGGRIFHAWLNRNFGQLTAATFSKTLTIIIGILFFVLGAVRLLTNQTGIFFIFLGFFIFWHLFNLKNPPFHLIWKSSQHKQRRLSKKGFLILKPILVEATTPIKSPFQHFGSNDYLLFFLPGKNQKMHIISEEYAWNLLINYGFDFTFGMINHVETNKTCRIASDEVE